MNEKEIEQLAEELNWYGDTCKYVDWHRRGNKETKNFRREQAREILSRITERIKGIENPYCDDPNSPEYQDLDIYAAIKVVKE